MRTFAIGQSDVGQKREHNEDSFVVDNKLGLFMVCDGIGGRSAGEVASATAVQRVTAMVQELKPDMTQFASTDAGCETLQKLVEEIVQDTSREIYELGKTEEEYDGMGTTLTLMLVADYLAVIAHVGDSRLYLYRANELTLITRDHTLEASLVAKGTLKESDLENSPFRGALSRYIGESELIRIDTDILELQNNDTFILCTDGLSRYLSDDQLLEFLQTDDTSSLPAYLIDFANSEGGKDNITCIVGQVTENPREGDTLIT